MMPIKQFFRCIRSFGRLILWLVLIVNIIIFIKVFSSGGFILSPKHTETHISLSNRKIHVDTFTFRKSELLSSIKNTDATDISDPKLDNIDPGDVDPDDVDPDDVDPDDVAEEEEEDINDDRIVDEDVESYLTNENSNAGNETKIYAAELTNRTNAFLKEVNKTELSNETTTLCNAAENILGEKCKDEILVVQNITAPTVKSNINPVPFPWFDEKWSFNSTAAKELKSLLEEEAHTRELFLTTKRNVKQNSTLQYEGEPRKRLLITSQVHNILPQEMPFVNRTLRRCSVVGSSGILLGSQCGKEIDSSDFVIRLNLPGVYNYETDVGSRTDLVTCNPTILKANYSALQTREARHDFVEALKEYGNASLYMPAFSFKTCTEPSFRAYTTLRSTTRQVVFAHPTHMWLVKKFWNEKGVGAVRISSGLLLFTVAMGLCDEVHLYGFWPFPEDISGRPVYYHYFNSNAFMLNSKKKKMHWHEMPSEFQHLRDLHMQGAINLHVGRC